jgi:hypothetical protein
MIAMYTARTAEIDEADAAIAEIKSQIDFSALKKNTGGLIFCHLDFIDSGVAAALCRELPFPVIGMTSLASADAQGYSLFELTLTILTSDDVTFTAGMTHGITRENYTDEINQLYQRIRGKTEHDPALILTFMPYMQGVSGHEVVAAMNGACGGIPLWGSITSSVDFNYQTVHTLCNGENLPTGVAMMFLNGPINPRFISSSIPERNISGNRAVITRSEGAVLKEINDMPVLQYLTQIGLVINKENITTTPIMVYFGNSEKPVALGFYALYEDGSVLTADAVPVGTSCAIGSIDAPGIFESAEAGLGQILSYADRQATLLLPCVTRYLMLAPEQEGELQLVKEKLTRDGHPFMMGYSGGEICPLPDRSGKLHNRFHNYTFCACVL